uniref:Uncharacterized protein n=1 Tax=Myotis myotis TaxID=51298 RepID=A0A7J7S2E9_MYOMY|nr:hypothetical protein mMyoMyo1_010091 [Myotis myotis]
MCAPAHTPQKCPFQKLKGKLRPREELPSAQGQAATKRNTHRPPGPEPNAPKNPKCHESKMWPKSAPRMARIKVQLLAIVTGYRLTLNWLEGQTLGARGGGRPPCGSFLNEWVFNLLGDKVSREKLVKTEFFSRKIHQSTRFCSADHRGPSM